MTDITETEAESEGLDLTELAAILKREYEAADSYSDQLAVLTNQAFEYYEAQPFGNEVEGRSQIVLPDVQETVDRMAYAVLRVFVSGDRVVEFEATDEETEDQATEATAAIDHLFMRRQDGYRILLDGCNDGLLRKIGVFKTTLETSEKVTRETVIATEDQLAMLPDEIEAEDAETLADGTIRVTLKTVKAEKKFIDYAVPMRNFKFRANAAHEDTADYLCHDEPKTRSALVEMGFDRDQIYSLPAYSQPRKDRDQSALDNAWIDNPTAELEEVRLCEEYARIDLDGDGIAERVKVHRVENEILIVAETGKPSIETIEEQPFSVFCPFPRPHRLVGYSLADKVMDIQLQRSFVARQLFDGMAFTNMPRPIVDSGMADADTYNDILTPIPGAPIRVKGGAASVQPYVSGFDVGKSLQVLEWSSGERESRSGLTRVNPAMQPETLNNLTATEFAGREAKGEDQQEFIARNLAETLARLFMKKYRLLRSEGEPIKVKVSGKYKVIDPSLWPDDMIINVRVGLGSGSKDKRIGYRMSLLAPMAEGLQNGLVTPKNAFRLIDGLVRDMGIGQGDDYWIDPDSPDAPQQQDKPDPEMAKAQAEIQQSQAKLALSAQESAAKLQQSREEGAAKIEIMQREGALKLQLERERAEFEAELARDQQAFEMQMAERQFAFDQQQSAERMALEARNADHKASMAQAESEVRISKKRPGGQLDE